MRKVLFLFGQFSDADVEWLRRHGRTQVYEPADILIEQGGSLASIFIVLAGNVTVGVDGVSVARLGPGEIVGEMSFVDSRPPSATVSADGTVLALVLSRQAISDHLTADPQFAARFYRAIALFLSDRLRAMEPGRAGRSVPPSEAGRLDDFVLDTASEAGLRFDRLVQATVQAGGYRS